MITVYVDVLICINILITYLFLVCVRVFLKCATNKIGVACASLFGGFTSLLIYVDDINLILLLLIKLLIGSVIVFLAFFPDNVKSFVKEFLAFLGITFLFGGAMLALEVSIHPENILYSNGTVYFDMDIKYLIGCVFLIYGVFLVFDYMLNRIFGKNEIIKTEILFRNIKITVNGFIDTGNSLSDGFSGRQVGVAGLNAISPLFNYEELAFLKSETYDNIPESLKGKIRFIPCKTVGESLLLPAFIPEKTYFDGKEHSEICIAITKKDFSDEGYEILLNKNMTE